MPTQSEPTPPAQGIERNSRRSLFIVLGLALVLLIIGAVAALQVVEWHKRNFVPLQVLASRSRQLPTLNRNSIEYKVYWALQHRVWADTISATDMGEIWSVAFTHAVEVGDCARASKNVDGEWNLQLEVPSWFRQSPGMLVTATLQTNEGVELVSKEVWTIALVGYLPDSAFEEIEKDGRLDCSLPALPIDEEVVLTMAIRPWDTPETEAQVVCRHVFPILVEPE